MVQILNIVVQDRSDPKETVEFVVSFGLRENLQQPEKALREATSSSVPEQLKIRDR